jgi:predicted flap endonuclease-1-like 5' DNA nuclease
MFLQELRSKSSPKGFPWWVVWVWLGILAGVFSWLWKQRSQGNPIQPVKMDLSFLRHPATPIAEPARPAEVLIASPPPGESPAGGKLERPETAPAKPDDLTVISGIGSKIASVLGNAGIDTFERLAHTELVNLREILQAANFRLADPESWPAQAQLAANGKWEELKEYLARRRTSRNA